MNAKNLVSNLEQAKKLKQLGISQLAYFYWKQTPILEKWVPIPHTSSTLDLTTDIAAHCDTELAFMLEAFYNTYPTYNEKWTGHDHMEFRNRYFETPAQASADYLIWLIEHETLTVTTANNALLTANKI